METLTKFLLIGGVVLVSASVFTLIHMTSMKNLNKKRLVRYFALYSYIIGMILMYTSGVMTDV